MSHSTKKLDFVLLYDSWADKGFWVTPSEAKRITSSYLSYYIEQIDEDAPNRVAVEKTAPPKPIIILPADEDYGAET